MLVCVGAFKRLSKSFKSSCKSAAIDGDDREHEAQLLAKALEGLHNPRRSESQVIVGRIVPRETL